MKGMFRGIVVILCFVSLMPVAGGCSQPEEENTFLELLSLLPASARHDGGIALIDYQRIWQVNGISLYDSDNQKMSAEDFLNNLITMHKEKPLVGTDVVILGSRFTGWDSPYMLVSTIKDEYIGFDYSDVNAEINNIGIRPIPIGDPPEQFDFEPDLMVAALGNYDSKATEDALNNRVEWPSWAIDNYSTENYRDINVHSWGDGTETHLEGSRSPPHLDLLGRASPLAVFDGHLLVGSSVDDVKSMIDAAEGGSLSLADIPKYAVVAQEMYNLGVFGAIIADEALANGNMQTRDYYNGPRLEKFQTFGIGPGKDDKGKYVALVLYHVDPARAEKTVSLLEEQINYSTTDLILDEDSQGYTKNTWSFNDIFWHTQIYTEGKVLIAKLYTDNEAVWYKLFFYGSQLLIHES